MADPVRTIADITSDIEDQDRLIKTFQSSLSKAKTINETKRLSTEIKSATKAKATFEAEKKDLEKSTTAVAPTTVATTAVASKTANSTATTAATATANSTTTSLEAAEATKSRADADVLAAKQSIRKIKSTIETLKIPKTDLKKASYEAKQAEVVEAKAAYEAAAEADKAAGTTTALALKTTFNSKTQELEALEEPSTHEKVAAQERELAEQQIKLKEAEKRQTKANADIKKRTPKELGAGNAKKTAFDTAKATLKEKREALATKTKELEEAVKAQEAAVKRDSTTTTPTADVTTKTADKKKAEKEFKEASIAFQKAKEAYEKATAPVNEEKEEADLAAAAAAAAAAEDEEEEESGAGSGTGSGSTYSPKSDKMIRFEFLGKTFDIDKTIDISGGKLTANQIKFLTDINIFQFEKYFPAPQLAQILNNIVYQPECKTDFRLGIISGCEPMQYLMSTLALRFWDVLAETPDILSTPPASGAATATATAASGAAGTPSNTVTITIKLKLADLLAKAGAAAAVASAALSASGIGAYLPPLSSAAAAAAAAAAPRSYDEIAADLKQFQQEAAAAAESRTHMITPRKTRWQAVLQEAANNDEMRLRILPEKLRQINGTNVMKSATLLDITNKILHKPKLNNNE